MLVKISDQDYFAHHAISQSDLIHMLKSPAHFHAKKHGLRDDPTPEMRFGSAVHCAVLEPEIFESTYSASPEGIDRRTSEFKEWMADKNKRGKQVITHQEKVAIRGILGAVKANDLAMHLLQGDHIEKAGFWTDQNIECRAKFDVINTKSKVIVDLKTTKSAHHDDFQWSVKSFNYDFQGAFYRRGIAKILGSDFDFIMIAVEKDPPYGIGIFRIDEEMSLLANNKITSALNQLHVCRNENKFPNYSNEIKTIKFKRFE